MIRACKANTLAGAAILQLQLSDIEPSLIGRMVGSDVGG